MGFAREVKENQPIIPRKHCGNPGMEENHQPMSPLRA